MRRSSALIAIHMSRGTTLIEMLVVVIILSVGMVTVAGMLNESINSLTQSLHHQRAMQLSNDLAEAMSGLHADSTWPAVIPANHRCEAVTCAPAELLAHIVDDWQRQIARRLPQGRGVFRFFTSGGQPSIEIRLEWRIRGGYPAQLVTHIPVTVMAETS